MGVGARSRTSLKKISLAEEVDKALDLKRAGLSIRKIASAMKISIAKAHELIEKGIAGIPEATRTALVNEIHERELALITAHWPKRTDPEHAKVIQASDKLLVQVLGLEAPKLQHLALSSAPLVDASPTDVARRVRELFGEGAAVPADGVTATTATSAPAEDDADGTSGSGAGEV